jgi:hypothetical protein
VRVCSVPGLGKGNSAVSGLDCVDYQQIDGRELGNRGQTADAIVGVYQAAVLAQVIGKGVAEVPILVNQQDRRRFPGGRRPGGRC